MTFVEFLIEKKIPFTSMEDEGILLDDYLLVPYFDEIVKLFPEFEFVWDYQRYKNEPNHVSG